MAAAYWLPAACLRGLGREGGVVVVGFTSNTSITYTLYAGASRLAVFWGRSDGHVAHPRGVSGVHGSGVMHACMYRWWWCNLWPCSLATTLFVRGCFALERFYWIYESGCTVLYAVYDIILIRFPKKERNTCLRRVVYTCKMERTCLSVVVSPSSTVNGEKKIS